jgi:hypothetical protein
MTDQTVLTGRMQRREKSSITRSLELALMKLAKGESLSYEQLGAIGGVADVRDPKTRNLLRGARDTVLRERGIVTVMKDGFVTRANDPGAVERGEHHVKKQRRQAVRAIRKASAADMTRLTPSERSRKNIVLTISAVTLTLTHGARRLVAKPTNTPAQFAALRSAAVEQVDLLLKKLQKN